MEFEHKYDELLFFYKKYLILKLKQIKSLPSYESDINYYLTNSMYTNCYAYALRLSIPQFFNENFSISTSSLKANINKYQLAFKEEVDIEMFKDFDVLYKNMEGRIITLVIRGNREEVSEKLEAFNPLILDVLNVNFEELFIYEHTGALNVK